MSSVRVNWDKLLSFKKYSEFKTFFHSLKNQIPDIKSSLDIVKHLKVKKVSFLSKLFFKITDTLNP